MEPQMIAYRTDMDRATGELLTGWPAVAQSVATILTTRLDERVMRLTFGSDLLRHIGRPMGAQLALDIYRSAVTAIHRWEPEYRVTRLDIVRVEHTGGLALATTGFYFPQGRLGDYSVAQAADGTFALAAQETLGRAA